MNKNNIKYSLEEIEAIVSEFDYELLSKEYKNNKQKLELKNKDGYYIAITLGNLKKGKLGIFNKSNLYTIQNIKLWCKLNNKEYELISNTYKGAHEKLQWQCLKEGCNELFEITWGNISNSFYNQNCPYCSGRKVGLSNCLTTLNPELAKEWHPTKNGDLTPYDITSNSNKEVWWQCSKNPKHQWSASVYSRNGGCECPYCYGRFSTEENNLLFYDPELCKEWDYDKNDKMPEEYTPFSGKNVWWKCSRGHEWMNTIAKRSGGRGNATGNNCPYCSGRYASKENNLLIDNPILCEEWDYSKNIDRPENYTPHSNKEVYWICKDNSDHRWSASINSRNGRSGCPECNKSKGEKRIKEIFINNKFIEINQEEYNFLLDKNNDIYFIPQKEFDKLVGLGRSPLSYDFYLPKYNLLIEYQGEYHDQVILNYKNEPQEFAEVRFIKQQEHDKRKKSYALSNNYNFLEIWYWDFNNIEIILNEYLNKLSPLNP